MGLLLQFVKIELYENIFHLVKSRFDDQNSLRILILQLMMHQQMTYHVYPKLAMSDLLHYPPQWFDLLDFSTICVSLAF